MVCYEFIGSVDDLMESPTNQFTGWLGEFEDEILKRTGMDHGI